MITCAAIKFWLKDEPKFPIIMTGLRHCDILERMFHTFGNNYEKSTMIQGFLNDNVTFLDRYDAKEIAYLNNQVDNPYGELYSEDVW